MKPSLSYIVRVISNFFQKRKLNEKIYLPRWQISLGAAGFFLLLLIMLLNTTVLTSTGRVLKKAGDVTRDLAEGVTSPLNPLHPIEVTKSQKEVFGFAPFWTLDKLDNVDFDTLTTLAYFSLPIMSDGNIDRTDIGYQKFHSSQATQLFKDAHAHGTRVVLTVTQMKNAPILALLDDPTAQDVAIEQIVDEVKDRGIDGINVDFEYSGNPGQDYKNKFSLFVDNLTKRLHSEVSNSYLTVSVYALSARGQNLYDISQIAKVSDGIFMMAYDYAVVGADQAMPTAPLYGYKEGRYWYDVSTAVDEFLTLMPADKLILGVPWYGYNYVVYEPAIKSDTRPYWSWRGQPATQTYAIAQNNVNAEMAGIYDYKEGWDEVGQVGWKAYYVAATGTWRMIFLEDARSLGIKIDFAKDKNLAGVGMWALGFDNGRTELWDLMRNKFGTKLASNDLGRTINENN